MFIKTDNIKSKNIYKCDYCGNKLHTAYLDGKPYCRNLVEELKEKTHNSNYKEFTYTFFKSKKK